MECTKSQIISNQAEKTMLIRVVYQDFTYDYVNRYCLNRLIETRKVAMFRRSSGWVIVGIDPLRRTGHPRWEVRDRRQPGT